ncbi:MAG: Ig-like domain-containing protein, partial [Candidatus Omnitrophica bacterium]|nr:Ig-like domain-containing protein [Candidatus Omnitrophota bacterium]
MRSLRWLVCVSVMLCCFAPAAPVFSQEEKLVVLQLARKTVTDSDASVAVPLTIASQPQQIATGLNFDVRYDSTKFALSTVTPGSVVAQANKSLLFSTPSVGVVRVVVFGLNQTTLADGELAIIALNILAGAPIQQETLTIENYYASDAMAQNITIQATNGSIILEKVNTAPALEAIGNKSAVENAELRFSVRASDADADALVLSARGLPTGASFEDNGNGMGEFVWVPGYDQAGVYENIEFTVSDGKESARETISIRVQESNRAPALEAIGNKSAVENAELRFSVRASDADADALVLSARGLPTGASFEDNGNGMGEFVWVPGYDQAGVYENIEFTVSDGKESARETISIRVQESNRAPVLEAIGDKSAVENAELRFSVRASDADADALVLSA